MRNKLKVNSIICGAMPEATKLFPDGYFNCSISSPPYWALRDYGVDGQLGLEPTFEEYIDKLCGIYDEVKRVLRDDGTCWVNIADTYGGGTGQPNAPKLNPSQVDEHKSASRVKEYLTAKSLVGIPEMFVLEMQRRGWIRRNTIIWHKPNPMPSSAKDRFTVDFEYVYFFVKSKKYWFEPQYEPADSPPGHKWNLNTPKTFGGDGHIGKNTQNKNRAIWELNPLGRNKRTVWTIPTQPYPEAHFATFPEKLVEPMIKAGCPEFVCTKCGKAREKIYEVNLVPTKKAAKTFVIDERDFTADKNDQGSNRQKDGHKPGWINEHHFKGYTDCGCNAEWRPGIVLDCFCWKLYHRQGRRKAA